MSVFVTTTFLVPDKPDGVVAVMEFGDTRLTSLATWHEANLSICSGKGMRLPTAYEVGATQIETYDFMPSAVAPETPSTSATGKVPLITTSVLGMQTSKGIWTATGSKRDINNYFALVPATTQTTSTPYRICANALNPNERCLMDFPKSDSRFGIRCVVPGF